ncbi:protein OXIDATIVE STRESS 3 LIKE 2 [Capsicum chacoense]|uniref:protein OXIDATIVE STRESS 3 LIKE 2 n=1 Tax=Capsicum annuum TaxID=4072 RepID=UPI0007BFE427|nr:protein OXIDATIVE STRESS 3 LIKE 2 [Capsicum annuum]KAF3629269.1 NAC domain protein [Capsicum annuum]KAF3637830.1 NAC domain protein [Capsicum annuum]
MSSIFKETDVVALVNQNEIATNVVPIDVPTNDGDMRLGSVQKEVDTNSSSSIGVLSDGGGQNDEDGEEALSKADPDEGPLTSLAALEAALPLKRGLSAHYDGKSRTFMNLNEVKSVKEIEKEESPLNKRRRLTMARTILTKWGSSSSSSSMPYLRPADD